MNKDKTFEKMKDELIEDNENKFGSELRDTYGDHTIDQSNKKYKKMSKKDFEKSQKLGDEIIKTLIQAKTLDDIHSLAAKNLCKQHQTWIKMFWPTYNKEAHLALCKMYTEDERFTKYYDYHIEGGSEFLYNAMKQYLEA